MDMFFKYSIFKCSLSLLIYFSLFYSNKKNTWFFLLTEITFLLMIFKLILMFDKDRPNSVYDTIQLQCIAKALQKYNIWNTTFFKFLNIKLLVFIVFAYYLCILKDCLGHWIICSIFFKWFIQSTLIFLSNHEASFLSHLVNPLSC